MKKKILLVDDDSAVRHVLARILIDEQYEAVTAASGPEALKFAANLKFDLILLDWKMPEQYGWANFQLFSERYPDVPIVLMTTRTSSNFPALAAGASAFLEKPLDFNKLLSTIDLLLEKSPDPRLAKQGVKQSETYYFPGHYARV
jgi:DNA-binding response OmpR family regulator